MTETQAAQVLPYSITPSRRGYGFLAVGGTILFPGVGHFIVGARRRGAVWLTASLALRLLANGFLCQSRLLPLGMALTVAVSLLTVVVCIDAYFAGRRSDVTIFRSAAGRYLIAIALMISGVGRMLAAKLTVGALLELYAREYRMSTNVMAPTLKPGDFVAVSIGIQPKRWDIIAYHAVDSPRIPNPIRVVGLPGETVEITSQALLINGQPIQLPPSVQPYQPARFGGNGGPGHAIHLGRDEYFVLGDNTAIARDSRYWNTAAPGHQLGALPADDIIGVADMIYYPFQRIRLLSP